MRSVSARANERLNPTGKFIEGIGKMKEYKIYINGSGDVKAVKQGWCWLGFFFTVFWALENKMWTKAAETGFTIFVIAFIFDYFDWHQAFFAACFWPSIDYGLKGNNKYKDKHYLSKGYAFKTTISASSADGAAFVHFCPT